MQKQFGAVQWVKNSWVPMVCKRLQSHLWVLSSQANKGVDVSGVKTSRAVDPNSAPFNLKVRKRTL